MLASAGDFTSRWSEAVERAATRLRDVGPGALVFYEEREDLAAGLESDGRSWVDHTRLRGLSVRGAIGDGRSCHRSDPEPDDAVTLADRLSTGSARSPAARLPLENGGRPGGEPHLDAAAALQMLAAMLHAALHRQPKARMRALWMGSHQDVLIGRPLQGVAGDRRLGCRLRLEASVPGYDGWAVVESTELGDDPQALASRIAGEIVERSDALRRARRMPAGAWPVVFAPGVSGVLLHELVGHALEGDVLAAGGSWLARARERVAPDCVRVIDDPRRGRAACHVDDEGEPARPVALIRDGRVVGRLDDLASARAAGRESSGHGRRSSYREPVLPRMGCTFLAPGRLDPREVLADVVDGVYVRRLEAASTDPPTGRAVFRVTDADRIRDGKLDAPIAPLLLHLEAPLALQALDRVASDLEFDRCTGSCVREGQPLSTSVGGPTCRIGLVNVLS